MHMTYGGRWVTPPELRGDMADPVRRHQVDPAHYYFRTNPLFETGAEPYAWLNDIVCVGSGTWSRAGSPTRSPRSCERPTAAIPANAFVTSVFARLRA
ncbi:hypothetical protein GCM10023196_052940 [Actinoallomurus vinaceus]|uniref:Uncharacterized protein n=1 Tax=Actinoallomurus vinaceus TaxID=1080074 RepID=A0ABP8UIL4_9ACTN